MELKKANRNKEQSYQIQVYTSIQLYIESEDTKVELKQHISPFILNHGSLCSYILKDSSAHSLGLVNKSGNN